MPLKFGSYECNPPFVPALLTAAAQRVLALLQVSGGAGGGGARPAGPPAAPFTHGLAAATAALQAAEAAGGALSFAVLMPGWQEVAGWQLLRDSPFLRHSLLVAAADHGYCDGSSHQARDMFRQSPFDTCLFMLQTSAAAARWRVTPPLAQQLQAAMAACVPSAAAAERQRKQRGANDLEWRGLVPPARQPPAPA